MTDKPKEKIKAEHVISYNQYVEIEDVELDREMQRLNVVVSPLTMVARRLESGKITRQEAAEAIRGLSILIHHKCVEILEQFSPKDI